MNEKKIDKKESIEVKKNLVVIYPSDSAGCGYVRMYNIFNYINAIYAKSQQLIPLLSSIFLNQQEVLVKARVLYFQRQLTTTQLNIIKMYKNNQEHFKYKLIYDLDDLIWKEDDKNGVPNYNFAHTLIDDNIVNNMTEIIKLMDIITVSTDKLKEFIVTDLKIDESKIIVIKNTVPMYLYGKPKNKLTSDLEKPHILYTQAPGHYSNKEKKLGDLENKWLDYLLNAVNNNEIKLTVMGGLPWMFIPIKDKIKVVSWLNYYQYTTFLKTYDYDIIIGPLIPNKFNTAKSDIKYIESCAVGKIFIGSSFTKGKLESPYNHCVINLPHNCSEQDIKNKIKEISNYKVYNDIIEKQFTYLEKNGRYTESPKCINELVKIL